MAATTFRRDVRAALVTILEAQKTATPALLKAVHATRQGFNELPVAYVSRMTETVTWTSGTRTRTMTGLEVTIADSFREAGHDGLDQLVDLLVDRFNAATQQVPKSILELTGVEDAEIEVAGAERVTYYRGVVLTFGRTAKWEGRS